MLDLELFRSIEPCDNIRNSQTRHCPCSSFLVQKIRPVFPGLLETQRLGFEADLKVTFSV